MLSRSQLPQEPGLEPEPEPESVAPDDLAMRRQERAEAAEQMAVNKAPVAPKTAINPANTRIEVDAKNDALRPRLRII